MFLFFQEKPVEKKQRIRAVTDDQREQIEAMTSPADMPHEERKRQYSALRRAINADASPALVCKFKLANDSERPGLNKCFMIIFLGGVPSCSTPVNLLPFIFLRWGMLKAWMLNPDLSVMDVEEKFRRYASDQRTDRYATVPYMQASSYIQVFCG